MVVNIDSLVNESVKNLYQTIFSNCKQSVTGTLFLVSDENRSGQVVFHQGQLLGLSYGGATNGQALACLAEQSSLRQSFTDNLIFPLTDTLLPVDAQALLLSMGMPEAEAETSVVGEPADTNDSEGETEVTEKPKSQRIYRGQVVK